jgi:hypothetical protein
MIPRFNEFGHLPVGGHQCTWDEFFDRFRITDRRRELCAKLEEVLAIARVCGFLKVMVGGSFPTSEENPGDIDLAWVTDFEVTKETVKPECIQLMDSRIAEEKYHWSMLFLPVDHDHQRIQDWALRLGYCAKTRRDRGMLVLDI